ncbi:MAG: transcriptional repressor [Chloroherpetonaceae bacterium]|nr:transcriptional repressor [Chloroherpetonaceae bacterium]MDW8438389.1 Fur family transcriptional regulator [Chloroherpetonaceae bacterium]
MNKYAALLRQRDLKATRARVRMLELLDNAAKPMTAQEIHAKIADRKTDLATVYRSLNKFADAGLIARVQLGDAFVRFELVKRHHHHIVCNSCGKIFPIDLCNLAELSDEIARKTGFRNIEHQVVFRGECQDCAQRR